MRQYRPLVTLHITDPAHLALRRGIRAAIALPLVLATALYLIDDQAGAIFAVFGTVGLLVNADFAGTAGARLASYLLTGVAGTVALSVGWAASFSTAAAVAVTLIVAFGLAFANLLRGTIAVGTPAVLLVFVVAVSIDPSPTNLPAYLVGWWLAVVVSTATALLLLPRNQKADQRAALADALATAARAVDRIWVQDEGSADDFADFSAAVDSLDRQRGGSLMRATGLSRREQALALLVDHVTCARMLLSDSPRLAIGGDAAPITARTNLARAVAAALDDAAAAMRDPLHLPTGAGVDGARVALAAAMECWVLQQSQGGGDPAVTAQRIGADHSLRMAALMVEQIVELCRVANGGRVEELQRLPPIPLRPWSAVVLSQIHPDSPWLRNALRSALGLGIAVLIVNLTGVEHGFWVLLGVISVLRFDAIGTRRFAVQAVVGTVLGVVVATIIITGIGADPWVLWLLLPPAVFLAAWSSSAISYPVGQAAFSGLVLIALSIIEWPPKMSLGLVRIEDVLIGAAVAIVVGLLLWPRGALGSLRQQLAVAVRAADAYLAAALDACTTPTPPEDLDRRRLESAHAARRASETFDLSVTQRGAIDDLRPWASVTTVTYLLISAGRIIAHFATTTPNLYAHPEIGTAVSLARADSTAHWDAFATALLEGGRPAEVPSPAGDTPYPNVARIDSAGDARALVISIWAIDWARHLDRLSTSRAPAESPLA